MTIDRRTFLHSSAAIAGGVVIGTNTSGLRGRNRATHVTERATSNLPFALATAGSSLAAGVDSTQTAMLVATDSGERLWVHDNSFQHTFEIACDGEVMEVTNIVGNISPQFFTVIRSVNQVVSSHSPRTAIQLTAVETL